MTILFNVQYLEDYTENELSHLEYAVEGDACMDLRSVEKAVLNPGDIRVFRTGVRIEIPDRHMMLVFSRSGSSTYGLHMANGVGVIDSGYRGEIKVPLKYSPENDEKFTVEIGTRIAQFIIQRVELMIPIVTNCLNETVRGSGGFGHTGK